MELNHVYCTDCITGMQQLEKKSVDVIVTSPPYNIGVKYNVYDDNLNIWDYLSNINLMFMMAEKVLKDNGSFFFNIGFTSKNPLFPFQIVQTCYPRFKIQNTIMWVKSIALLKEDIINKNVTGDAVIGHYKPINSDRYHHNCFEYIFHLTKSGDVKLNKKATGVPYTDKSNINRFNQESDKHDRGNVWFIPYETKQKSDAHPSQFPIKLAEMCILDHGTGGVVLDPYVGVGNSMLAAKKLGCKYIGFDIDNAYVEIANQRLDANI